MNSESLRWHISANDRVTGKIEAEPFNFEKMKNSAQGIVRRTREWDIGAAQFNYTLKASTGQSEAANDAVFDVRRLG